MRISDWSSDVCSSDLLAVRMMDNAIDASRFPLKQQAQEAQAKRRIGLGVTGLADALIMCRARYGSSQSVALVESWMKAIRPEEHTSELQSLMRISYAVFCLKKKKKRTL